MEVELIKVTNKCEIELLKAKQLGFKLDKKIEALEDELDTLKQKRDSLEVKMTGVRLYEAVLSEIIK